MMGVLKGKVFPYAPIGQSALPYLLPIVRKEEPANAALPFRLENFHPDS